MKEFLKLKQDLLGVLSSSEEFQFCFKNVHMGLFRKFQECFQEVSRVCQGKLVLSVFKRSSKSVSGKFQFCFKEVSKEFQGSFKEVSRVF